MERQWKLGKAWEIQSKYDDKQQFIKDFIACCRRVKNNEELPYYCGQAVLVCGEYWSFHIYGDFDGISTSATFVMPNVRPTDYPLTKWGEKYSRWDVRLREFLNREICKN